MADYKVAIVGRPNVGKSALFNRLVSRRVAIVEPTSGVTRDRLYGRLEWRKKRFTLIDTGGIELGRKDGISSMVAKQINTAIAESDALIFVCDGKEGLSPMDEDINRLLKKSGKRVIWAVNKIDNERERENIFEFFSLGADAILAISASHGRGIRELLNSITEDIDISGGEKEEKARKIAVVGRPNVGKSSFVNCLLDEERVIVDDAPGTTRDSIDTRFHSGEDAYILIDTAGIRHKRKIRDAVGFFSFARSRRAISRCDGAIVMLDALDFVLNDDIRVIDMVLERRRPFIVLINKWDLVKGTPMEGYEKALRKRLRHIDYAPVLFTSCVKGRNIKEAVELIKSAIENSSMRSDTKRLNEALKEIKRYLPPELAGAKLKHIVQTGTNPPEFVVFRNGGLKKREPLRRFMENRLRERLGLKGTPIAIHFKK